MSNSLTSHEDLTPYIESLMKISSQAASLERRRSFAAEPEVIIKELLTELMNARKNTQITEEIAKKFLEAYNTSIEDQSRQKLKITNLSSEINGLNTLIQKYQKDIEVKDNRYESITLEVIDMERALKQLNFECSQLKKERDSLKKEIQSKEQSLAIRETSMQQRKNLLVEVEKEKEKEKDKEADKGFQIKYEQMVLSNKKKQAEIDDLVSRLHEIEALWALDKNNADKLQKNMGNLREELFQKKIEFEETLQKYRDCKERVITLKEELIMQKAQNDSLVKEYERQKSTNFKNDFEGYDEPSIKNDAFRRSRTEILSDYFDEFEENKTSDGFFTINSSDKASPKFMLVNSKRTEVLPGISVFASKKFMKVDENVGKHVNNSNKSKISIEAVGKIEVQCNKKVKEVISLICNNEFVYKSVLNIVNEDNLGMKVNKQTPFNTNYRLGIEENGKIEVQCNKGVKEVISLACNNEFVYKSVLNIVNEDNSGLKVDKKTYSNYNYRLGIEEVSKVGVHGKKSETNFISLFSGNKIVYKCVLSTVNTENIHIGRVPIFTFDDAASEESIETVASRSRKTSIIENRDPIKEFFIFTCQAAKLNSIHKDKLGTIPINKLYERVLQQGVPFNLWHDYITDYLHSRIKVKI